MYDFSTRGTIKVSMTMDRDVCADNVIFNQDEISLIWISCIAMVLSLISFIAIWYHFYRMAEHLSKMQKIYDKRVKEERD